MYKIKSFLSYKNEWFFTKKYKKEKKSINLKAFSNLKITAQSPLKSNFKKYFYSKNISDFKIGCIKKKSSYFFKYNQILQKNKCKNYRILKPQALKTLLFLNLFKLTKLLRTKGIKKNSQNLNIFLDIFEKKYSINIVIITKINKFLKIFAKQKFITSCLYNMNKNFLINLLITIKNIPDSIILLIINSYYRFFKFLNSSLFLLKDCFDTVSLQKLNKRFKNLITQHLKHKLDWLKKVEMINLFKVKKINTNQLLNYPFIFEHNINSFKILLKIKDYKHVFYKFFLKNGIKKKSNIKNFVLFKFSLKNDALIQKFYSALMSNFNNNHVFKNKINKLFKKLKQNIFEHLLKLTKKRHNQKSLKWVFKKYWLTLLFKKSRTLFLTTKNTFENKSLRANMMKQFFQSIFFIKNNIRIKSIPFFTNFQKKYIKHLFVKKLISYYYNSFFYKKRNNFKISKFLQNELKNFSFLQNKINTNISKSFIKRISKKQKIQVYYTYYFL